MLLFWFSRLTTFSISQRRLNDILNPPRCGVIMFIQENEGTKKKEKREVGAGVQTARRVVDVEGKCVGRLMQ